MKLKFAGIAAAVGAILFGSASCVKINEELGENFIPTHQIWNVFPCEPVALEGITMERSDSLSGYSTSRITFGSVRSENFTTFKTSCFTLVPLMDSLDFGTDPEVKQFHFTAIRDTVSVLYDKDARILQSVYAYSLTKPLDSTMLYSGAIDQLERDFVSNQRIASGVYNGGDSLSFDFTKEYANAVIEGIKKFQSLDKTYRDSLSYYLKEVPGIYIRTDEQVAEGGRINMFKLPIAASDGYIDGNYAELKIRSKYDGATDPKDTSFIFYFGPSEFLTDESVSYPSQYAFNAASFVSESTFYEDWAEGTKETIYVEGGTGYKPVVRAAEIKRIVSDLIENKAPETDTNSVVINKATIVMPYNVGTDYKKLDKYPMILSPTVKRRSSDGSYVSYAGLTDSSIESENQGDINRSLGLYCPDISHHVQEIVKLKRGQGTDIDPNETEKEFQKRLSRYDVWFLIMHEEITETSSSGSSYDDYYNNLMYNSYYNNMMYDPYGYGYGYGGYGYGYGGYGYGGYGYNNYYNYYMMAAYANASSSSTTTSSSIELDRDRIYNAMLNGPGAGGNDVLQKPHLKITFSAPKRVQE